MAADVILVDYDRLKSINTALQTQQNRIHSMNRDLQAAMDALRAGGWLADSATDFNRVMSGEVMPAMIRLDGALGKTGETILAIYAAFAKGEEQAVLALKTAMGGGEAGVHADGIETFEKFLGLEGEAGTIAKWLGATGALAEEFEQAGKGVSYFKFGWDLGKAIQTGDPEAVADTTAAFAIEQGIGMTPWGKIALATNAANQVAGQTLLAGGSAYRDYITGGDASLQSYQTMNAGLANLKETYEKSNIDRVIKGTGTLAVDVARVYTDPIMADSRQVFANPSFSNMGKLATDVVMPMMPGGSFVMAANLQSNPALAQKIATDGAGLAGDTVDTAVALVRTPGAVTQLGTSLVVGSEQRLLEVLPISATTRSTLMDYSKMQQSFIDHTIPSSALSSSITQTDFGKEWRSAVGP